MPLAEVIAARAGRGSSPGRVVGKRHTRRVDGDVGVKFTGSAPRTIDVTTVDGDIAISLPDPGPYLIRASAASTRVRVSETNDPARATAQVTLRSTDGDVTVDTGHRR